MGDQVTPQQGVRVDDNGNPIQSGAVRVDDSGNPVAEKTTKPAQRISSLTGLERPKTSLPSWATAGSDQSMQITPQDMATGSALAMSAVPVVGGVARGVGIGGKIMGGMVAGVSPIVKYEATRLALTKIGVPESLATIAGMAASGYSPRGFGGAGRAATTAAEDAAASRIPGSSSSGGAPTGPLGSSPRGGRVTVPEPVRPPAPSTSGIPPAPTSIQASPTGGSVTVPSRPAPSPMSTSGIPAPAPVTPVANQFSVRVNDEVAKILAKETPVAPSPVGIKPVIGRLTFKDLTPEGLAAYRQLVDVEHKAGAAVFNEMLKEPKWFVKRGE